jgi:hypothetical protein
VRRILSISLLLLFMLPLVSPLFAASTEDANVPICCRRNGRHHCTMASAAQRGTSDSNQAEAANFRERCPYNLVTPVTANLPFVPDEIQTALFTGIVSSPARHAQAEAGIRTSSDRSHQKRGPPSLILFHS